MLRTLIAMLLVITTFGAYADLEKQDKFNADGEMIQLTGAEFWHKLREGEDGKSTSVTLEHTQLINVVGQRWREVRNEWVTPLGLLFLGGSAGALLLFYLWAGRIQLANERTGKKVLRWTPFERAMHWFTAINFLILGFSGVVLLYGKHFILPIVPLDVWGAIINGSKVAHNYLGPLFVLGLLCMLVKWMKNNFLNKTDIEWFKQGGGLLPNGKHPDAGFCNGGEKIWFWLLATVGVVVCISGLFLDFPIFGQTRQEMQIANVIHAVASLGLFAAALGHIYIGTAGTEGALEGMATGYVDETWAKQHHKLWFDEVENAPESTEQKSQASGDEQRST
ncbi:formate dehydrogenase subunit gamma [Enterovibrio sp. ZSDZ35]|uniref:Formate dehydrogenase subunit gamma n=1 Tax=Enterovibrio qingdaonensis TaxID=2899818 RepID=A0ABT5QPZ1_9GAMM|nr:formate dehydrogenase subunit gamma [Enterovibrio sp. ZSDZ35]MDD1783051.1 formate dehydrogenase subunit gamma [Enterovibrio sp. ZSDZ35]